MGQNGITHNFCYSCALVPKLRRQVLGHVWYPVAGSRSAEIDFEGAVAHTVSDTQKEQKLDNGTPSGVGFGLDIKNGTCIQSRAWSLSQRTAGKAIPMAALPRVFVDSRLSQMAKSKNHST
jgi:hypothetical protein